MLLIGAVITACSSSADNPVAPDAAAPPDAIVPDAVAPDAAMAPGVLGTEPAGALSLLSLVTVRGTGFDPVPGNNVVTIGTVAIQTFVGDQNSATQLSFQIPDQFPDAPQTVDLTVTRGGLTSRPLSVQLLPKLVRQPGPLLVLPRTTAVGVVAAAHPITLQWLIAPQVADTVRYRLVFFDAAGASAPAWDATVTLAPSAPQQVAPGAGLLVAATVTVPAEAVTTQLALEVTSSDGETIRTSDPVRLTVGTTPELSDPRSVVSVATTAIGPSGTLRNARVTTDGVTLDGLQLGFAATATVPVDMFVTALPGASGDYVFSAATEGGAWQVLDVAPATSGAVPAAQSRRIAVALQNTAATQTPEVSYLVVRAAHQLAGVTDFTALARIPIQGAAF